MQLIALWGFHQTQAKKKSEYFDLMQVLLTKLQEDETMDKAATQRNVDGHA